MCIKNSKTICMNGIYKAYARLHFFCFSLSRNTARRQICKLQTRLLRSSLLIIRLYILRNPVRFIGPFNDTPEYRIFARNSCMQTYRNERNAKKLISKYLNASWVGKLVLLMRQRGKFSIWNELTIKRFVYSFNTAYSLAVSNIWYR